MAIGSGLKLDIRRKQILDILIKNNRVRVSQLSQDLNVSEVTIRNDLTELEKDGYLERVAGGAVLTRRNFNQLNFQRLKQDNVEKKLRIAKKAASLIQDAETLMINAGTTAFYVACELKQRSNLNIVTNSVPIAMELGAYPTFRMVLLGGDINAQYSFTYGGDALAQMEKYKADKVILSVDGVRHDAGLTTYHAEEAEVIRQMIARSHECIVVADARKIGKESFSNIGSLEHMNVLVTNAADVPDSILEEIQSMGVTIYSDEDD